ncbi:MAG TPA: TAXI family TRAP transporter solute-binding subunit [Vineibacter sp.]|nr:TAXI family TRAP transporter solute-binding subunit [Vineibacter sp.]
MHRFFAFTAAFAAVLPAMAQDIKLPQTLTFTAYDTGSSGFNIAVAVGKMLKDKHGAEVRVLPAGNDVARLAPLRAGRAQVSANGTGTYFAQEAVFEFGAREWGPQPLRLLLASNDCNGAALGVAKDTGVKAARDLKGKRIGMVVGSPALNQNALAVLAFGGLTTSDVKLVEFSGYGAMWKGVLNNEADAAFASTISAQPKEVDTSPRGLLWVPTPRADAAGWQRLNKLAPYVFPHKATCGAGISPQAPVETGTFPYPIFMGYATLPADIAYGLTKAMIVNYDAYKDAAPGAAGLDLKLQKLEWVVPFHDGAIKALKEAGAWSDAVQKHNDGLVRRQSVLGEAWSAFVKASPPEDADAFRKAWAAARRAALEKAGLDVVFE